VEKESGRTKAHCEVDKPKRTEKKGQKAIRGDFGLVRGWYSVCQDPKDDANSEKRLGTKSPERAGAKGWGEGEKKEKTRSLGKKRGCLLDKTYPNAT